MLGLKAKSTPTPFWDVPTLDAHPDVVAAHTAWRTAVAAEAATKAEYQRLYDVVWSVKREFTTPPLTFIPNVPLIPIKPTAPAASSPEPAALVGQPPAGPTLSRIERLRAERALDRAKDAMIDAELACADAATAYQAARAAARALVINQVRAEVGSACVELDTVFADVVVPKMATLQAIVDRAAAIDPTLRAEFLDTVMGEFTLEPPMRDDSRYLIWRRQCVKAGLLNG